MEKVIEKIMGKIKKWWGWATIIVTAFSVVIGGFNKMTNYFDAQNEELAETSKLAQQAIIWNKEVPNIQRAEVCDLYLSKGFDSYTKKLCEKVILQDENLAIADEESVFIFEEGSETNERYNY